MYVYFTVSIQLYTYMYICYGSFFNMFSCLCTYVSDSKFQTEPCSYTLSSFAMGVSQWSQTHESNGCKAIGRSMCLNFIPTKFLNLENMLRTQDRHKIDQVYRSLLIDDFAVRKFGTSPNIKPNRSQHTWGRSHLKFNRYE